MVEHRNWLDLCLAVWADLEIFEPAAEYNRDQYSAIIASAAASALAE
jgi:hypothetical protein